MSQRRSRRMSERCAGVSTRRVPCLTPSGCPALTPSGALYLIVGTLVFDSRVHTIQFEPHPNKINDPGNYLPSRRYSINKMVNLQIQWFADLRGFLPQYPKMVASEVHPIVLVQNSGTGCGDACSQQLRRTSTRTA